MGCHGRNVVKGESAMYQMIWSSADGTLSIVMKLRVIVRDAGHATRFLGEMPQVLALCFEDALSSCQVCFGIAMNVGDAVPRR